MTRDKTEKGSDESVKGPSRGYLDVWSSGRLEGLSREATSDSLEEQKKEEKDVKVVEFI